MLWTFASAAAKLLNIFRLVCFILTERGWILSPAYDLNPVEDGIGLKLNISDSDNSLDLKLAMDVREYFRLDAERADRIVSDVKHAVRSWRNVATNYGISRAEQNIKASAFQVAET